MTTPTQRTQILTSLNQIKSFNPCASGWRDILVGQKKTQSDSVVFPLVDCLESNSVTDVLWLFRQLDKIEQKQIFVIAARGFADSVKEYKNRYAAAAAVYAADAAAAAAVAAVAAAAVYAADATDAADAAAAAVAAAAATVYAADAADAAAAAYAAYRSVREVQKQKNKDILKKAILDWEAGLI